MGNFNRGDKFGGKKKFGNDRGFGGGRPDRPTMHQAVCSDCGRNCEVPFRPTGDKPVYCNNCFGKNKESGSSRFERRSPERFGGRDKQKFEAVCDKCRKVCEVPFRPTGDKPVYCSDCFGKSGKGGGENIAGGSDNLKKQIEMINNKLDNIIKMILPKYQEEKTIKKEEPAAKTVKKTAKPAKAVSGKTQKKVKAKKGGKKK